MAAAAITEAAAAAAVSAAAMAASVATSETATAADVATATMVATPAITEVSSGRFSSGFSSGFAKPAADTSSAGFTTVITEAAAAASTQTGAMVAAVATVEAANAADVSSATVTGTLSVDVAGSVVVNTFSGTSATLPGLSSGANVVVGMFVLLNGASGAINITSVTDTAGLTWTLQKQIGNCDGLANQSLEWWTAVSVPALSNDVITLNLSAATVDLVASAFTISGANLSSRFDPNSSLPAATACTPGTPVTTQAVSTTNLNTVIVSGWRQISTASPTAGPGFTQILGTAFLLTEFKIVTAAQTGLLVTEATGSGDANGVIADAIVSATTTTTNAVTEAATAAVVVSATMVAARTVGEAAAASDLGQAGLGGIFPAAITEAASAAATQSAVPGVGAAVIEAANAADVSAVTMVAAVAATETANAADAPNLGAATGASVLVVFF